MIKLITFPTVHQASENNIILSKNRNSSGETPSPQVRLLKCPPCLAAQRDGAQRQLPLPLNSGSAFPGALVVRLDTFLSPLTAAVAPSWCHSIWIKKKLNSFGMSINHDLFSVKALDLDHVRNLIWVVIYFYRGKKNYPLYILPASFSSYIQLVSVYRLFAFVFYHEQFPVSVIFHPGWNAVVWSELTAASNSWAQVILPAQPPE